MKWPFKRITKEPGWLAIRLLPDALHLVHGQYQSGGAPVIDWCGAHALEGEFAGADRMAKELELQRYQCSTLLLTGEYQLLQVDAPNVPQLELKTAVRWRIKDMLDYHADDATIDVLAVPSAGAANERGASMYAVAARNDVIQSCIKRFETARIALTVIDIPELAQRNVASLYEPEGRGVAMLYVDQDQSLLTVNFRHELLMSRRIEAGARELGPDAGAARDDGRQRVLLELQRTFDHLDRQFAYAPVGKLMLAPEQQDSGLLEFLGANLDLPVERASLGGSIAFGARAEMAPADEWRMFHLIGASLRNEEKAL
ncbi:MAG: agglutinin biogenesis protein MshI [Burkholderiales bacterium]